MRDRHFAIYQKLKKEKKIKDKNKIKNKVKKTAKGTKFVVGAWEIARGERENFFFFIFFAFI